jgi:hypothetical protein
MKIIDLLFILVVSIMLFIGLRADRSHLYAIQELEQRVIDLQAESIFSDVAIRKDIGDFAALYIELEERVKTLEMNNEVGYNEIRPASLHIFNYRKGSWYENLKSKN